jgi:glutamate carboxypeptidase
MEALQHQAVLVTEGSADGGALKTERKGTSMYEVTLHGRAAHAGLEPERGVSATVEAAHQVLAVAQLTDVAAGTTVTPTVLSAGTTTNTVPAQGKFMVDVRVRNLAEQTRVDEAMRALQPVVDGAKLEVTGGPNRPPLELSMSSGLFELAARTSAEIGFELTQAAVGGASDGNFTAGVGVPTLDGLGAVGGGAHADSEHVLVSELVPRTTLLAALVRELT